MAKAMFLTDDGAMVRIDGVDVLVKRPKVERLPPEICVSSRCHAPATHQVSDLSGREIRLGPFCLSCARTVNTRLLRKYRKLTGDRSAS